MYNITIRVASKGDSLESMGTLPPRMCGRAKLINSLPSDRFSACSIHVGPCERPPSVKQPAAGGGRLPTRVGEEFMQGGFGPASTTLSEREQLK